MTPPFRVPVQLVTNYTNFTLLSRASIDHITGSASLFQFTKNPTQEIFIKPNLRIQAVLGHGRKQVIPYIQALRYAYIDNQRNLNDDQMLPDCLYSEMATIKSKVTFLRFVKKFDFSIFPIHEDFLKLIETYERAGIKVIPMEYKLINFEIAKKDIGKIPKKYRKVLEDVNLDYLWKKVKQFQEFVQQYNTNGQQEHRLLWLNKELELVSPILITYDGYTLKSMRDGKKQESMENIVGMRNIKTLKPMIGYRVYGHFALCCLEFLHDIENGLQIFVCKNCGNIQKRNGDSKQKFCTKKVNAVCFLERQAKRQQKFRKK